MREQVIAVVDDETVQVGGFQWPVDKSQGRYVVVGYRAGKKVVLSADSLNRVIWGALTKQKENDMWVAAAFDLETGTVAAQSLTPTQPGYVKSLRGLVETKRRWQKG